MDAPHLSQITKRIASRSRGSDGFALIELLTALAVLSIVLFATLGLFEVAQRTEPKIAARNSAIQTAQVEIERMVRDLRQAYAVLDAGPNELSVLTYDSVASCGGGGSGASRECRVTYRCDAGACTRTAANPDGSSPGVERTLLEGLAAGSVFSYSPYADAPDTVFIRFEMEADDATDGEDFITLEEGVTMRNVATGR